MSTAYSVYKLRLCLRQPKLLLSNEFLIVLSHEVTYDIVEKEIIGVGTNRFWHTVNPEIQYEVLATSQELFGEILHTF